MKTLITSTLGLCLFASNVALADEVPLTINAPVTIAAHKSVKVNFNPNQFGQLSMSADNGAEYKASPLKPKEQVSLKCTLMPLIFLKGPMFWLLAKMAVKVIAMIMQVTPQEPLIP